MIHITRHAQSVSNAGLVVDVPSLAPLSIDGEQQARDLADAITDAPDLIVTSVTLRSVQTAAPLSEKFPTVPVEIWPVHEFYFIPSEKIVNTSFDERRQMLAEYFDRNDPDFVGGAGCESFNQFIARVREFLARLDHSKNIIIVSHGHFMRGLQLVQSGEAITVENFGKLGYIEHCELLEIKK